MKSNFIVLVLFAFACMTRQSSAKKDSQKATLMQIYELIVNDPDFFSLSNEDKIDVIILIHNTVNNFFKKLSKPSYKRILVGRKK